MYLIPISLHPATPRWTCLHLCVCLHVCVRMAVCLYGCSGCDIRSDGHLPGAAPRRGRRADGRQRRRGRGGRAGTGLLSTRSICWSAFAFSLPSYFTSGFLLLSTLARSSYFSGTLRPALSGIEDRTIHDTPAFPLGLN